MLLQSGSKKLNHYSLLAMFVNDNACKPDERGALESIASKPAPTDIAQSL